MSNCSSLVHRPLSNIEKLGVAAGPGDEAIILLCITMAHVLRKISQDLSGSNLHTRISGAMLYTLSYIRYLNFSMDHPCMGDNAATCMLHSLS